MGKVKKGITNRIGIQPTPKPAPKKDTVGVKDGFNVTIDKINYDKIMWYVHKCPKEISGLGKVVKRGRDLHITNIYLLQQECTAVETELDAEAVASLLYEAREDEGEMMFWWHSHVNMGVNWSGTDYDTMRQLGKRGMIVSTVFNKRAEHRTAIYMGNEDNPILPPTYIGEGLKLQIIDPIDAELEKQLEAEYKAKVTLPEPKRTGAYSYTPKWGTGAKNNQAGHIKHADDDQMTLIGDDSLTGVGAHYDMQGLDTRITEIVGMDTHLKWEELQIPEQNRWLSTYKLWQPDADSIPKSIMAVDYETEAAVIQFADEYFFEYEEYIREINAAIQ